MNWVGDMADRVRGVMGMVHVVARQGAKWAWEEQQEENNENEEVKSGEVDGEKDKKTSKKSLEEVVEGFGLEIPYKQASRDCRFVSQDSHPLLEITPKKCPSTTDPSTSPKSNKTQNDAQNRVSHHQKARQGFHTSRLFRDRVPESPFQDRVVNLEYPQEEQKLSGYLTNGPGSGGSEEPLLRGVTCSLPRIVVISPADSADQGVQETQLSRARLEMRSLTPVKKASSMEERSSSNQSRLKLKRNSSMSQMKALVSDSIDEMVKVAEVTKPVMIMKAAMGTVTFKREDNIKREVDMVVKPGKYFKEDLSLEHYNRLKDAFHHHDQDIKGFLTKGELRSCLRTLGHNPTEQEIWRFMAQVDVDHSGTLDFDEFFCLMSSMMSGWDPQSDLGACWQVLDPAGSGKIKLGDLVYLLKTFGAMIPDDEIEEMFDGLCDTDDIDFNQFLEAVVGIS
eukprot:GFUD01035539.1.p1 GENE.GFUD01035539.1~~GFUD01035539.1.p1  ORF type:complete len:451 (+),score=169.82 GFUD01035539.1:105-1457(+)